MGNVVDYVRREFHGFAELPFGDVDSLVLAELSYMRLSGLVPAFGEARSVATVPIRELLRAESYDDMFVSNSSDINEYRLALLRAVCESPRFRALRVGEYAERLSEREQQQFAAMTFDVGCGPVDSLYVAFRGTDGTLVGWKEDFNMAVRCPVPSQESAYRYVNSILDRSEGFLSSGDSPRSCSAGIRKAAIWPCMRPCVSRTMTSKWLASARGGSDCCPHWVGQCGVATDGSPASFPMTGRAFRNRRCAVRRTVQSNRVSAKPCPNRPSWACCCTSAVRIVKADAHRHHAAYGKQLASGGKWRFRTRWTS